MICEVFSDASVRPDFKVGGWGGVANFNKSTVKDFGYFSDACDSPARAEAMALANTLSFTKQCFPNAAELHIYIDCKGLIQTLENKKGRYWSILEPLLDGVEYRVSYTRKHKHHRWCDRVSKECSKLAAMFHAPTYEPLF